MTLPVVLRDEAQADFDAAFDYYESQRSGLGAAFAAKVEEVFERIAANPLMHAVVVESDFSLRVAITAITIEFE